MRTRRRTILACSLLAALLGAVVVGSISYFLGPREPTYEGQSLSVWIAPFSKQTKTGLFAPGGPAHFAELQPVRRAVAALGTNALPFLIGRLNYRESWVHKKFRQLADKQPLVELRLDIPQAEYIRAIRALAILGPKAKPAVPNLVLKLSDPLLATHVIYALQAIGEEGMQALVIETTNHSSLVRMEIAIAFLKYAANASLQTNASAANIAAAGLTQIARDSASFLRTSAIHQLGMFRTAATASNAIPVLTDCLSDPDVSVRMAAASTLRRFGYAVDLPALLPGGPPGPRPPFAPPGINTFRPSGRPIYLPP